MGMLNFLSRKKKNVHLPKILVVTPKKYINNNTLIFYQNFFCINSTSFNPSSLKKKGCFLKFFFVRALINYYRTLLFFLNEFIYDRRYIYSILRLRQKGTSMRRSKRYVFHYFYSHFLIYSLSEYQEKYFITAQHRTLKLLLLCENFNLIWYLFWKEDWTSAKEKKERIP